ncbi:acyltransferase [Desulfomicrobium sp. ZS1]|uniref:acyltransferase n=1 Tax=Desulfomicrobium sp. ZS1 TaxID=2952228 RepID=UPI0020B1D42B|nr:acyltransferase [Desulfomicrobium sp. ZS1]UTF50712.1 acyltransferase [Desulfomicrobium sp. ZS1]
MLRQNLKKYVGYVFLAIAFPFAVPYHVTNNRGVFTTTGQLLSLLPGKVGSYLRSAYYSLTLKKCGKRLYVDFGSYFSQPAAEIHDDVFISTFCIIGNAKIGNNVGISPCCHILSGGRQHASFQKDVPIIWQSGGVLEQVSIGENSWIGQASVVMADIGKQNIIGAGSVVVKKTGDYEVHAGNPARLLRRLF